MGLRALSGKFSPSRILPPDFSLELDEWNISHQFCVSYTGSLSRDVSTSNWHALSSRRCPAAAVARHPRTRLTTYTWSRKVLNAGSACPPRSCAPFYAHTTHLAIGALLLPGHIWNSLPAHLCDEDITCNTFKRELKTYWF